MSLDPKIKIGVGAFLFVEESKLDEYLNLDKSTVINKIQFKVFEDISSTKLEVLTSIWALNEYKALNLDPAEFRPALNTDSQCIVGLNDRRKKLEKLNFQSSTGKDLNLAKEYAEFFTLCDELNLQIVKIQGHSPSKTRMGIEKLFTYVDRESRRKFKTVKVNYDK